jgi:hypothetical protein
MSPAERAYRARIEAEIRDLRSQLRQIPMRFVGGASFKTNMWTLIGGKTLGYSGLVGATYQTSLPADLPEYDLQTMPTTADGVGYIMSHDTGATALFWNGPPGNTSFANSQAHLWVGMRMLCIDSIQIKITSSNPERFQKFYVNAVLL